MIRLTREQVRSIDKLAIERYHIPGIVLMENAARAAADVASGMIDWDDSAAATVVCGGGNNGGDGLAIARHLVNRGADVWLVLTVKPESYQGDALTNWKICQAMDLVWWSIHDADCPIEGLVVDAILGTGLTQPPREDAAKAIEMTNRSGLPVLAIDVPSGLECDTGEPLGACVRASETVTFVAEKTGFANPASKQYTGTVTVGDIGCPRELIEEVARGTVG